MTEVIAAVLGALLGVAGALVANLLNSRRNERVNMTASLIAEYFSADFLHHRISIGITSVKVREQVLTFDEMATGFWYPGDHDHYTGDEYGSLNEHQHIEAYIGFLTKLDYLLRVRRVYATELRDTLGMKMVWEDALMVGLSAACQQQAEKAGVPVPDWVASARKIHTSIVVPTPRPFDLSVDPSSRPA